MMVVPLPCAMRFLRVPLMISGRSRSLGVMDKMMASMCAIFLPPSRSVGICFLSFFMPGSMPRMPSRGPRFLIMFIWPRKSLKSNFPLCIRLAAFMASFSLILSAMFSTIETTSPMSRIRPAMRSGWNSARLSSFSPSPMYLMGFPVTARMDRAAPPRASPSSLVRTMPVMPTASSKWVATETACCPVAASETRRVSLGFRNLWSSLSSAMSLSSISCRPAVSKMRTVPFCVSAHLMASFATLMRFFSPGCGLKMGTSTCSASVASCSTAAGR